MIWVGQGLATFFKTWLGSTKILVGQELAIELQSWFGSIKIWVGQGLAFLCKSNLNLCGFGYTLVEYYFL
jgi:hypothetical protein